MVDLAGVLMAVVQLELAVLLMERQELVGLVHVTQVLPKCAIQISKINRVIKITLFIKLSKL